MDDSYLEKAENKEEDYSEEVVNIIYLFRQLDMEDKILINKLLRREDL